MIKKAFIGFVAVGAVVGLRPVARRVGNEMREHCRQMAAQCKQTAAQLRGRGEAAGRT